METTQNQKAASRANGRKSRGPVTEQGKRNSSRNATKHGLLANSLVIEFESRERFESLLNSLIATFDPQDAAEYLHVETIAAARWRQSRLWAVQSAAINQELRRQAPNMADEDASTRVMLAMRALDDTSRSQSSLSLYEHRFDRQQRQALEALDRLKQRRAKKILPVPNEPGTHRKQTADFENDPPKKANEPDLEANKPATDANEPDQQPLLP